MKKLLALILALLMCLSLCACGEKSTSDPDDEEEKQEQEEKDKDEDDDKDSSKKDDKDEDEDADKDDEDTPFVDMSDELGDYQTGQLIAIDGVIYDTDTTVGDFLDNGWEIEISEIYERSEHSNYDAEYEALYYDVDLILTKNNSYFETSVTSEIYPEDVDDIINLYPDWYLAYDYGNVNMQLPGGVILGEVFENKDVYDVYCSHEDYDCNSYLCDTDYCYLYFETDKDNVINYIQYIPFGFE